MLCSAAISACHRSRYAISIPHLRGCTKGERLRRWLAAVEHFYSGRILAFGIEEARRAGAILDRARAHHPRFEDIAIAATAAVRGFTVLTATERHFAPLGGRMPIR